MGFNSGPVDFIDESRIGKLTKEKKYSPSFLQFGEDEECTVVI